MNRMHRTLPTLAVTGLVLSAVVFPDAALAGSGGTEFNGIWDTLTGWVKGTLGQIIVLAMIIVGIVAGIARQSIMAFAIGVGGGIGLFQAPDVIESILSATVSRTTAATGRALELAPAFADVVTTGPAVPHP